jgi:hypothetical protein
LKEDRKVLSRIAAKNWLPKPPEKQTEAVVVVRKKRKKTKEDKPS